jgi:hypothetical protein
LYNFIYFFKDFFHEDDDCSAQICSGGHDSKLFNKNNEFEYEDTSVVDIEIYCEKKTIHFFINKKQCPYYISSISSSSFPLLFAFSSRYCSTIIQIISLFKILLLLLILILL